MYNEDKIIEVIDNLTDGEKVEVWNEYCDANNYTDDRIYYNEPDELLSGQTPSDILMGVDMDEYRLDDTYAYFTNYGLRSSNYLDECPFDSDAIANYVINNEDSLNNDEIQEALDEFEESEEDEDEE